MLTDKIRLSSDSHEPEDLFSSSLATIFPDDITNQHGDAQSSPIYLSPSFGPITLSLADPDPTNTQLFSHFLWNASLQLAEFIEDDPVQWSVANKEVLELGAGTALSGIIASLMNAKRVVITDYPAEEVLENIRKNVSQNIDERRKRKTEAAGIAEIQVCGHEWGVLHDTFSVDNKEAFSTLLVADCLWMPWQHGNLLKSIRHFLEPDGRAWVIAGFHTGREKMRGFYEKSALDAAGLRIENIWERNAEGNDREWVEDRGKEDITERKRWLVIAILKRKDD